MFTAKQHNDSSHASSQREESSSFIQPKLNVGKPGDKYEVEADKAADQIVAKGKQAQSTFITPSPSVQKQSEEDVQKQEIDHEVQQKPVVDKVTPVIQLKPIQVQQKQPEEEVQAKEEEIQEKEEQTLQKKSTSAGGDASGIEDQLSASKGGGSSLDSGTKGEMESGFGSDFSGVRVHNDSNAVQMNQELGSQAFTNGNDIYFNEGKYNPESDSGKHLLAHELTHTLQQGASPAVQSKMIQKVDGTTAPSAAPSASTNSQLTVNASTPNLPSDFDYAGVFIDTSSSNKEIKIPKVKLPAIKQRNSGKYGNSALYKNNIMLKVRSGRRGRTNQVGNWKTDVGEQVETALTRKKQEAQNSGGVSGGYYYFKLISNNNFIVFGTDETLAEQMKIPFWNKLGTPMSFQVDHVVEDQLEGKDEANNYELLEASANMSAGSALGGHIRKKIRGALEALNKEKEHSETQGTTIPFNIPSSRTAKRSYKITFDQIEYDLPITGQTTDNDYWSREEIKGSGGGDPAHIAMMTPLTGNEIQAMGNNQQPQVFFSESGGIPQQLPAQTGPTPQWLPRVNLASYDLLADTPQNPIPAGQKSGTLNVEAYKASQVQNNSLITNAKSTPDAWDLIKIPGFYGGAIRKQSVISKIRNSLRLPGMSPIVIDDINMSPAGLRGNGKVLPTLSLVEGLEVEILIDGAEIQLRKTFSAEDLSFPSPFELNECDLTVFVSTESGLGVEGRVGFGINNVGEGHIGAAVSTSGGFNLEGEFNFDSELFDPASINMEYKDNIWTIGGEIGISEGKIRGVKSATITASYSENNFTALGEAELDIPGVERGTMEVNYGDDGFSIAGDFNLSSDIPGIRGGRVSARIAKQEGQENYDIMVSGTAEPDVPGINSSLTVTYENGALTIEGTASYSRGMLSGEVTIGATNKGIDDDGNPTGEVDDTMRVYGGGSLTLQLTPWLAATAAVKFLPNGEMEVTARLDAPSYEVFRRQEVNRNLFSVPTVEIPLFAIPLGPRSVGLVAQIGGGLDFTAGFGPGELRNMSAEITYNPDREEETTVNGHGEFAIPADAGLTLRGDLSLGVSIAIASITGGIELAGTLGLAGEALASVDVNWSPQTGLSIDAMGSILVSPKFTFDINAFIRGTLGIGWFSISETWRKNLMSYEWGPGIEFGIRFPVNYTEGEPFSMSFDDIEVVYPELDIPEMAKGVASDVKDEII